MDSSLIQATGLSRHYTTAASGATPQSLPGLHSIDLEIRRGEFIVLMGPSGCGKTTLLNLLGLVDRPSGGELLFEGQPTRELPEHERTILRRRRIGYVFQFFHLLPYLTLAENVSLPLLLDGATGTTMAERARALLERMGLGNRHADHPHQLSGGQMQRVAIARALAAQPSLLLADEPTGSLDSASGISTLELFRTLAGDGGHTVVMATHSAEAARYGDRIVRLSDGKIVTDSPGSAGAAP